MWTLFCRNYCRCSLLAHPACEGCHFWGIASLVPLYCSPSNPNRKLHTLWLMPATGRCQSVEDWTIVSSLLAGSRGSAVNCRPAAADYYQQLVPSWNHKSSKFRLHASSSPVHRWSMKYKQPRDQEVSVFVGPQCYSLGHPVAISREKSWRST